MFAYLGAVLNMLTKPFQNEMHCRPINQLIIITQLQKKQFFYQQLGNSPFAYDSNVHFARQINGRCNAASVAALFLEDMQTFPQSANGNCLFPDNRAPSWEILSCKSHSSLLLLLQDEAASALSRTQMSGHIHPEIKCPVNLQNKPCVRESRFCDEKNGIFKRKAYFILEYFFITKWWPMQREEMTSQLDLHFTPLFERRVSVLCQFLHSFRPQAQGSWWIRNRVSGWPQQLLNLDPDRSIHNCKGVRWRG